MRFNQALLNNLPSYSWLLLVKRLGNQQVSYCVIDVIEDKREDREREREKRHEEGCKWEDGLFLLLLFCLYARFSSPCFLRCDDALAFGYRVGVSPYPTDVARETCFLIFYPLIYHDVYRFFSNIMVLLRHEGDDEDDNARRFLSHQ